MREIKFRGRTKEGNWVYGNYSYDKDNDEHYIAFKHDGIWMDYIVDGKTVGQFTGLPDKNKVEIYEGDLVTCMRNNIDEKSIHKGKIIYVESRACFAVETLAKCPWWMSIGQGYDAIPESIEVIGNKFENPELLEEK